MQNRPCGASGLQLQVCDSPRRGFLRAIVFHGAESFTDRSLDAGGRRLRIRAQRTRGAVKGYDASAPRNKIHQSLKCSLHRVQIFVDIGVVEFHRGQDGRGRKVVKELRPLVEER